MSQNCAYIIRNPQSFLKPRANLSDDLSPFGLPSSSSVAPSQYTNPDAIAGPAKNHCKNRSIIAATILTGIGHRIHCFLRSCPSWTIQNDLDHPRRESKTREHLMQKRAYDCSCSPCTAQQSTCPQLYCSPTSTSATGIPQASCR